MELEQSKMAAATYRDMLVSRPAVPSSQPQPRGPSVATSALVHPPAAQKSVVGPNLDTVASLGPIVAQLGAIVSALTAAGILTNQN